MGDADRIYDMPEEMQDYWRRRERSRAAWRVTILVVIFFVACILLGMVK